MHPDRKTVNWSARFSPQGDRLLTEGGAPSRLVQIWDATSKKEIRRIETLQRNHRGTLLTPDWKTVYVPVQNREVKTVEQGGKKLRGIQYSGAIRVFDLASGKEQEPLPIETGWGPAYGQIDPSGRYLVCAEEESFFPQPGLRPRIKTEVWELATGKKSLLSQDYAFQTLFPDGQTVMVGELYATSVLKLLRFSTGKELANVKRPVNDRFFWTGEVAPDGSVVAVSLGGKKGAPLEVLFLDGKTLEERGKLVGKGVADGRPWRGGRFTPDGRRFVIVDKAGNILLWDVAGKKLERTLGMLDNMQVPDGSRSWCRQSLAVSPDGKILAVGWTPKWDEAVVRTDAAPDPQDVPQPRVSLIPLDGSAPSRVLIAPPGFVGDLAFSPDGRMLAFGGAGAVHLFDLTR
jgi:WD40 repeat protein